MPEPKRLATAPLPKQANDEWILMRPGIEPHKMPFDAFGNGLYHALCPKGELGKHGKGARIRISVSSARHS
ncbi:hypothetical protein ODE01S_00810 [Oceanithermus desulfurans NBRC 100063]|uniref:Uncharacterized protein n=1 Tax=Oceanithermus desulfurans NBRC 100063 TaxID=1227550 RepID=A0A511RHR8_9DEIN|nr:hypothetical protein ODE01S_00810 [Oceanithermus desulfurans NBRC 100063]